MNNDSKVNTNRSHITKYRSLRREHIQQPLDNLRTQLRQKCKETFKNQRHTAFQQRRNLTNDKNKQDLLNLARQEVELLNVDDDLYLEIYKELKSDIENWLEEEMKYLTNLEQEITMCPLCKINQLGCNSSLVFCLCGFKGFCDDNLVDLNLQLREIIDHHSSTCSEALCFYSEQSLVHSRLNSLQTACFNCDFFKVIIN